MGSFGGGSWGGVWTGATPGGGNRVMLQSGAPDCSLYSQFNIGGSGEVATSPANSVPLNAWTHIALTYDGSELVNWINGVKQTPEPASGVIGSQESGKYIGKGQSGAYYFNGLIDEVKIYDYARSPAQIAWDFNKGKPVGHWRMDEATSGSAVGTDNIKDHSVHENHGSGSGTNIAWTTGKYGGALDFNGSDDFVAVTDDDSLDITDEITVSAWIQLGTFDNDHMAVVAKDQTDITYWFGVDPSANPCMILSSDGSSYSDAKGGTSLSEGTWYHIAGVYNGTQILVYLNGVLDPGVDNPESYSSGIYASTGRLRISGSDNWSGNDFDGIIDDVRVYNYARTAQQIKQDYNAGMVAYFGE
jgi:hypothetical protein